MSTNAYIGSGTNRISYGGDSTVYGGTPQYHYIEVKLKNSSDQVVSSTAYSNSASYIDASNLYMYPASGYYNSNAWSYSLSPDAEDSDSAGPMYYS